MDDHRWIDVSPRHRVRLATEYLQLFDSAPHHDFVVHTLEKREANGLPLMSAEIVIASQKTREQFRLAATYPLHFRKTYFPGRMRGDPSIEYERSARASQLIGLPPPIGHTPNSFRSCLIPGQPYRRLTPFTVEPEDRNLRCAAELALPAAAGLWRLAEDAYGQLLKLHAGGLAHGDLELQNFIVCPAPLEVVLIDFEAAVLREDVEIGVWATRCTADAIPLLREAFFLQATLGRQRGTLADASWGAAPKLFRDYDRFRRAIENLGNL
ncbi:MAG TPA: hypothetical protein VHZ95_03270 [Polyangiales bacterium]|nr:hypothetical protein [Polyangiales bacterium]